MSYWHQAKLDDLDFSKENETIEIYCGFDDSGSRYVEVKVKDIEEVLDKYRKAPKRTFKYHDKEIRIDDIDPANYVKLMDNYIKPWKE